MSPLVVGPLALVAMGGWVEINDLPLKTRACALEI